uniref:Ubiquitin-like-specific protease ESD4 isoform X6 n=1 Tax=Nicotiana sylvestris TaxID=4096 RepID=A0A1U7X3A3_NICSY|nr:PREDICTED: ubiquitin-like-specific protease ESD4 isoform X6 [Nicotiana sylvestris]
MGALTSYRKRGDDFFTLNYKTPVSNVDPHISKKPRLSMNQTTQDHSKTSTVTRLFTKYPSSITPIKREIHAPCRRPSSSRFGGGSHSIMGNFLVRQLYRAKRSAFKTFRYVKKKDKEVVINIDDDDDGDSNVEELGTGVVPKTGLFDGSGQRRKVSNAKTGLSNGSGGRWKESDDIIEILDNSDDGVVTDVQLQSSSVVTVSDDDVNLLKVENAEKMMDSLSLSSSKFDDSSSSASFVPSYKKLLDSAEKRNNSLKSLQFHIEYTEKILETYKLLRPQKKDEQYVKEDVITEPFVQIDKEEEAEVSHALSNYSSRRKVLVTHENSNIDITGEILQCLRPGAWLNDEVINVYLELLKEREKREPQKFLRCHFFNTFFYKKLISGKGGYNYQSVKRWTSQRKLGYSLFECDKYIGV